MKRLATLSIIFLLTLAAYTNVFAASSCTATTKGTESNRDTVSITWACTAHTDGTFPSLGATGLASPVVRGWVTSVETWEGSPIPTSGSSFTLVDSITGRDVMGRNGSGAITATPDTFSPAKSGWVDGGTLSPVITGNSVNGAKVTIRATVWKQKN